LAMSSRNVWLAFGAVVGLAGLDLLGAFLAKEFSLRPRSMVMIGGAITFVLLFVVYAKSLSIIDLWIVTFGWIVLLEVGVLLLDRFRFVTHIPPHKVAIAGLIVILQVALMLPGPAAASN
jgi:hypothetical protein